MALKPVRTHEVEEIRPRLKVLKSSLDYARSYAEDQKISLEQALSQAIDQVCAPGKKKETK